MPEARTAGSQAAAAASVCCPAALRCRCAGQPSRVPQCDAKAVGQAAGDREGTKCFLQLPIPETRGCPNQACQEGGRERVLPMNLLVSALHLPRKGAFPFF